MDSQYVPVAPLTWSVDLNARAREFSDDAVEGRSPHGERGLKFRRMVRGGPRWPGRSPHGERGLK